MKRRIFDIFLAIIFGTITTIAFFSLYGIIASFSIEKKISHWIFRTPKEYRVYAFYIHEFFLQIFSILPLVGILGTILGLTVINRPKQHGVICLVSAIMTFLFIQSFITILDISELSTLRFGVILHRLFYGQRYL